MQGNDSEVMCKITRTLQSIIFTLAEKKRVEWNIFRYKMEQIGPKFSNHMQRHARSFKLSFYECLFSKNMPLHVTVLQKQHSSVM